MLVVGIECYWGTVSMVIEGRVNKFILDFKLGSGTVGRGHVK